MVQEVCAEGPITVANCNGIPKQLWTKKMLIATDYLHPKQTQNQPLRSSDQVYALVALVPWLEILMLAS